MQPAPGATMEPGMTSSSSMGQATSSTMDHKDYAPTQKVRQSYQHMAGNVLKAQKSNLTEWFGWRTFLHNVFETPMYSIVMGIVILMNALLVIHETDLKAINPNASDTSETEAIPVWVSVASYIFLSIYFVEICLRLYVYRWNFFRSGWNIIDFIVVVTDLLAEVTKIWAAGDAPSVSILRIFRLARLLRLIAMLSLFHELQTMLLGFGSAMKAMVWASFMIGVVITVCSICAVEFIHPLNVEVAKTGVYGDCRRCARAFETVAESNLTFIQQIIAGDSWGKITIPIIENYPGAGVFFLIVFGLIDLGVLNLILTVIVNAAESARETNHEMQLRGKASETEKMKEHLKKLCGSLDHDEDGRISLEEFMTGADENEEFRRTLALLDIQRQDAEVIYHLMDEDRSGDVDYHEFVNTMITTKHETVNTKLLFIKAGLQEVSKHLVDQEKFISEELFAKLISALDIAETVKRTVEEDSSKPGLQPDRIMAEFAALERKLDHQWEQVQMEQARSCRMLEKVMHDISEVSSPPQPQPQREVPAQNSLLSLPGFCSSLNCEIRQKPGRIYSGAPTPVPESRSSYDDMGYMSMSRSIFSAPASTLATPDPGSRAEPVEGTRRVN